MEGMVEVRFAPEGSVIWVRAGTTLLAAAAAAGIDILTGCTQGMCGTDPVRVVAGEAGLEPAADHERGTLERMGLESGFRLACSARVRAGTVEVELGDF